jgi:DDE superfamily endonuclease
MNSFISRISCSENGWTDGAIAREWIEKVFDAETKVKANGCTRVLFMDGHNSHYTPELLNYAQDNNIEIIGYPPHCTHALQGLDVACFTKMKECWKEQLHLFEEAHGHGINKSDFVKVWGTAYLKAFTQELIEAAFSSTGIHPFNPNVIAPEQMKPSEPTSINSCFPLPQASPTRAVMAAFRYQRPTALDLSPSTHQPATQGAHTAPPTPETPMKRRALDPDIDPSLYTPSKRMRLLYSTMASTSSGSYLVSKTAVAAAQASYFVKPPVIEKPPPLPEPDWSLLRPESDVQHLSRAQLEDRQEKLLNSLRAAQQQIHARNLVIEGSQAQLIVQAMGLTKLMESLEAKEKKKTTDRSTLFPGGNGRVLTNSDFIKVMEDRRQMRADEEEGRRQRQVARAEKRAEKEMLEDQWQQIKRAHQTAVNDWNAECARLMANGVPKKDLPKRPIRPLKSTLTSAATLSQVDVELDHESDRQSAGEDDDFS